MKGALVRSLLGPLGLFGLLGLPALLGVGTPSPARAEAAAPLADLLAHRALRGASVGVAVRDLSTGELLFERDATRPLIPASNQKLMLAAAALAHWGPSHRFETPVLVDGPIDRKGVLDGTLWLVGSGDPSLVSERLWKLAEEIRLQGVIEIRGGLGIDTTHFDGSRFHADWQPVSARAYHAPTSAFAANYSSFRIDVGPAPVPGLPATLRVAPAVPYFRLRSQAKTLARAGRLELDIQPLADGSSELVRTRGSFSMAAQPRTYWRSVRFPELYAASVLRAQLEAQGVHVIGSTRLGRVPESATELFRFSGATIGEIVRLLNKYSNNFVAEQLFKALGAEVDGPPGTWEKGARAVHAYLASIGVPNEEVVVADGSGLSARNRVPAAVLVRVIRDSAARFAYGPEFMASLPIGGRDGTLEDRLEPTTPVRGKTGHLNHVGSLSGILSGAGNRALAFAVLVNGARGSAEEVDGAIDAFVERLAELAGGDGAAQRRATE
jgi:D-alanyl-D-alanine carboxypeptidase/D-alanyl-D-alanine-endopeptidase (penicillin-binding protein 4)